MMVRGKNDKKIKIRRIFMILNVKNLNHGFGDRAIFENVSFRLLKGEHIGLIGANGEGKSTFMNIITGKLMPDEGTVEWAKKCPRRLPRPAYRS
jgi:ATPase subunit of ABC transporter with duplicated ATPase domains